MEKAGLKDIARKANVSLATVSYVINNRTDVKIKPETRRLVLQAAKELNYYPDSIAKSLKTKRAMSVAVITDKDLSSFVFTNILSGMVGCFSQRGYSATLSSYDADFQNSDCVLLFRTNKVDGLIFVHCNISEEQIGWLCREKIPFVIVHNYLTDFPCEIVTADIRPAVLDCLRDFLRQGRKRILYVRKNQNLHLNKFSELEKAAQLLRGAESVAQLTLTGSEEALEREYAVYFSDRKRKADAILFESPAPCSYFLRYAYKNGISVPADTSIACIGNSTSFARQYCAVSSIEAPLHELGTQGAERLFGILYPDEPAGGGRPEPLQWSYVKRES